MDELGICSVISLSPKLEPIAGIAFALNLAYIGLLRYRYRQQIREAVLKEMGDLTKAPDNIKDTSVYKSIVRLSSLGDYDRKLFKKSDKNADLTGAWSVFYEWWFECHQDRIVIIFSAFLAASLVLIGVVHDSCYWTIFESFFSRDRIGSWIILITVLQILPVASVLTGWGVTTGALAFAKKNISDIKKMLQEKGPQAAMAPNNNGAN